MDPTELAHNFKHHPPNDEKVTRHENVRSACLHAAEVVDQVAPDSREKSLALTKLEEAMMWANAAIARNP